MSITLSALHYYPVKSCRGISITATDLVPTGLARDRLFMVVDANGHFLSQRSHPEMALISPHILEDKIRLNVTGCTPVTDYIIQDGASGKVTIWKDRVSGVFQSENISQWLSDFLKINCRLVYLSEAVHRPVAAGYALNDTDRVSFADGYPFLLTSETSLSDLNSKLSVQLPMDRFRPNIVVRGTTAYEEDTWKAIRINDVSFAVVKPCARCVITTINQDTAQAGKEPLQTLAGYRLDKNNKVLFGQNLIHRNLGRISVGDTVEILETKDPA